MQTIYSGSEAASCEDFSQDIVTIASFDGGWLNLYMRQLLAVHSWEGFDKMASLGGGGTLKWNQPQWWRICPMESADTCPWPKRTLKLEDTDLDLTEENGLRQIYSAQNQNKNISRTYNHTRLWDWWEWWRPTIFFRLLDNFMIPSSKIFFLIKEFF